MIVDALAFTNRSITSDTKCSPPNGCKTKLADGVGEGSELVIACRAAWRDRLGAHISRKTTSL